MTCVRVTLFVPLPLVLAITDYSTGIPRRSHPSKGVGSGVVQRTDLRVVHGVSSSEERSQLSCRIYLPYIVLKYEPKCTNLFAVPFIERRQSLLSLTHFRQHRRLNYTYVSKYDSSSKMVRCEKTNECIKSNFDVLHIMNIGIVHGVSFIVKYPARRNTSTFDGYHAHPFHAFVVCRPPGRCQPK